jgi:hypothetical protein
MAVADMVPCPSRLELTLAQIRQRFEAGEAYS